MTTFLKTGTFRGGTNPTTILNTQAQAYMAAHANPTTGTVTDPAVLGHAEQMLAGDNTPAGLKAKADIQNQLDALTNKLNGAYATTGMIDYQFKNAQYNVGKNYAGNVSQMLQQMYGLYDFHGDQIENHVQQLQGDGQDATALQAYGGTIADQAAQYEKLLDSLNQGGQGSTQFKQAAQNFGMAIGTDSDGKITSFVVQPIPSGTTDARMTIKGANDTNSTTYVRTNSTYGGIPVYVIPQSDANDATGNSYTAKVGNLTFSGTKSSQTQNALTLTDTRPLWQKAADIIPDAAERLFGKRPATPGASGSFKQPFMAAIAGGVPTTGNKAIAGRQGANVTQGNGIDLFGHITPDDFSNMSALPAESIAHDMAGNYYYVNDDGTLFQAPNANILSQHIGIPADAITKSAQPISSQDLEKLQSTQDPSARANAWLTDPTETSPLSMAGGKALSMATNPGVASIQGASLQGGAPATAPVGKPNVPNAIQQPAGAELAQNNTQNIVSSAGVPAPGAQQTQLA